MAETLNPIQKFEVKPEQMPMLERVNGYEPLDAEISSRAITEHRPYNPQDFSFQQEGEYIQEYYKGAKNGAVRYEGHLEEGTHGSRTLHIMACRGINEHMLYEPSRHALRFGEGAAKELEEDPEVFDASSLHELAHLRYFQLDTKDQRELNDLFLNDPNMKKLILKFANAMYSLSDPEDQQIGEHAYLDVHDVNGSRNEQTKLVENDEPGLKDNRTLEMNFKGRKREIAFGLITTELLSYLSNFVVSMEVFDKVAKRSETRRGKPDARYDTVFALYKYLKENPVVNNKLGSYGLYKDNSRVLLSKLESVVRDSNN